MNFGFSGGGGGGGAGAGSTVGLATSAAPYTVKSTDGLVEADNTSGNVTIHMEATPAKGKPVTVKLTGPASSTFSAVVDAGSVAVEDPQQAGHTSTSGVLVNGQGAASTWRYNGTLWRLVG